MRDFAATQLDDSAARVLASLVAAENDGEVSKTQVLDQLDAWRRIGVSRARFMKLVHDCHQRLGERRQESSWMPLSDRLQLDRALDSVEDPELRLMVCRLAASVITADGRISEAERSLYDHTLARWRISTAEVTQAILRDRLH